MDSGKVRFFRDGSLKGRGEGKGEASQLNFDCAMLPARFKIARQTRSADFVFQKIEPASTYQTVKNYHYTS